MEEKNVLELVELNKKLFSIQGIKKSVEEAIEKHKNTQIQNKNINHYENQLHFR